MGVRGLGLRAARAAARRTASALRRTADRLDPLAAAPTWWVTINGKPVVDGAYVLATDPPILVDPLWPEDPSRLRLLP